MPQLAARLVEASDAERVKLIEDSVKLDLLDQRRLAYALKDLCLDGWSGHSAQALGAAATLKLLSELNPDPEITALATWTTGVAALIQGKMEEAIVALDNASARFRELGQSHPAANTQVSKLIALAMLGRYAEAIECGLSVREELMAHNDLLAAAKIEHNLGNIYFRRDQYQQAEQFQRAARERFIKLNDEIQITKSENSLALTLSQQHKIREAEQLYEQALARAERVPLLITQAEIESSIGMLALYQGQYDRALDYLERSRRKYVHLKMPHVSAMTEQEIADAYLELNLAQEAAEIYERVAREFADLGMRAEEARAITFHGRAALLLGQATKARSLLEKARELYEAEGNQVGAATVRLAEAQFLYSDADFSAAVAAVHEAKPVLVAAATTRRALFATWFDGECTRAAGVLDQASAKLAEALVAAQTEEQRDIAARCLTSLGLIAVSTQQTKQAESYFKRALELIEELRAPIPAEEFRTAFFSDKLVPYNELVRLCLITQREVEAFKYVEQARSRGLVDLLRGSVRTVALGRDDVDNELLEELDQLRSELNYFYNKINRLPGETQDLSGLREAIHERERKTQEIGRQLQHRGSTISSEVRDLDIQQLQRSLGTTRALIEYTSIDDELVAFVVTDEGIQAVRNLGSEKEVAAAISQFRFQVETFRHGSAGIRQRLPLLMERAQKHLQKLYERLLRPLESLVGERQLVLVPYRSLHYLPLHALHDGTSYLIETHEVSYVPSATVLLECLARSPRPLNAARLFGVSDEQTQLIGDEVRQIASLFASANSYLDEAATIETLFSESPNADLLHLACHAQFRPDNPFFSSLRLGNGWLTVRETYGLKLNCRLVTLSACETGVSEISPGEELIGLARGLFSAGSPSIQLSLWAVDDEATVQLMVDFYKELLITGSAAGALRQAQLKMMKEKPHPFFWAPFVLMGKW
ncbi:MAG TPA: CHAT domain-containing tetratricopeptide repeat protein [Pyrinomonadaceae bacterium]|nr:CHAT domain-containing tetratricopeptide repeat protein [Pyrinomonadaceae bacterium]